MHCLGKGIAMAALIFAAAWLEVNDKSAGVLWIFVLLWILFGDWE